MSGVTILRAADRRPQPWKNGGGLTSDVLVHPPGADLAGFGTAGFDWRISVARVDRAGPFSTFPGIDRILTVVTGTLDLDIGESRCSVDATAAPVAFRGEDAVFGRPVGGSVCDVNVMVRRATHRASVARHTLAGQDQLPATPGMITTVIALDDLSLAQGGEVIILKPLDGVTFAEGASCRATGLEPARVLIIAIGP